MPDIYCSHCGEPTDMDELHDMRNSNGDKLPYQIASNHFAKFGCGAFKINPSKCTNEVYDEDVALRAFVNQELSEYADDWIE